MAVPDAISLDDSALSNLLAACPRRSMLLLEDV